MDLVRGESGHSRRWQSTPLQIRLHRAGILPERKGFRLRQAVGDSQVLLRLITAGRIYRHQEVERRARTALMQQLEKRVLRIITGLAPDDRAGRGLDGTAVQTHRLT